MGQEGLKIVCVTRLKFIQQPKFYYSLIGFSLPS